MFWLQIRVKGVCLFVWADVSIIGCVSVYWWVWICSVGVCEVSSTTHTNGKIYVCVGMCVNVCGCCKPLLWLISEKKWLESFPGYWNARCCMLYFCARWLCALKSNWHVVLQYMSRHVSICVRVCQAFTIYVTLKYAGFLGCMNWVVFFSSFIFVC